MIEQGTAEWHAMRLGKVTASKVSAVMARTKSGWGAERGNYLAQLVVERMTGIPTEGFTNDAMRWGTEKEPDARDAYSFYSGNEVALASFVDHPKIAMSGASPDGFVGDDGLVEIKCPNSAGHIETLLGGTIPNKYVLQVQWQLACTGRKWCDFVSFDPRMPEDLRLFTRRIARDDAQIADMEKHVVEFLAEVDAKLAALDGLRNAA